MQVFFNQSNQAKLPVVEGKFYVVDAFSGPLSGPFDTADQASHDRKGMIIEEDCYVGECIAIDRNARKYIFGRDRVQAEVDEDSLKMRSVTVYFSDGDTITTNINGADDEIADHYLGKRFEAGSDTKHHVALCVRFNDTNETLGLKVKNIESGDEGVISCVQSHEMKITDTDSYNEIMLDLLCGNAFALADVWVYDLNSNWIRSVGYPHPTVQ